VEGRPTSVLACQTKVVSDIVVRLPDRSQQGLRVLGDSHSLIDPKLLPTGTASRRCTEPAAGRAAGFHREHYSDWTRSPAN